jgi:L-amino acid N-acyltransferase YncA
VRPARRLAIAPVAEKLLSKIFPANLARSCGFREVGLHQRHARLDGEWREVILVERLIGDPT